MALVRMLAALAGVLFIGVQTAPPPPPVTVSAAVSLTEALTAAAVEYSQAGGGPVRFNFTASNVLARQIVDGAPVDVFMSADERQMDVVADAGLIRERSRVDVLSNQLAVVVSSDRIRPLANLRGLTDPAFRKIALGDPDAVPAGVYAKQYLRRLGIWDTLAGRIVPTGSVRAALTAVESGAADAAIVYRTDARIATRASIAYVVPVGEGPPIRYPAAVIRTSSHPDYAQRFIDFLRTAEGLRVLTQFGFAPVR
jgi:molybdate transport system substrate-binding protein